MLYEVLNEQPNISIMEILQRNTEQLDAWLDKIDAEEDQRKEAEKNKLQTVDGLRNRSGEWAVASATGAAATVFIGVLAVTESRTGSQIFDGALAAFCAGGALFGALQSVNTNSQANALEIIQAQNPDYQLSAGINQHEAEA